MIADTKTKGTLGKATRAKAGTDIVRSRQLMAETIEPVGRPSKAVTETDNDAEAREIQDGIRELREMRETDERQIVRIPLDQLERHPKNRVINPDDPSIDELGESILANGQFEPCRVRQLAIDRYQIISGERRTTAMRRKNMKLARCIIVNMDDASALREVAVANSNREDLNPIQRAELMQDLMRPKPQGGSGLSLTEAGKLFGLNSESGCKNALRMLKLPAKIRELVINGELAERVVRRLIPYMVTDEISNAIAKDLTSGYMADEYMGLLWQNDLSWIEDTLKDFVRPLSDDVQHHYQYPKGSHSALFDWQDDDKLIEQLKVVELPWSIDYDHKTRKDRIEPRKFATNIKLWHKLNDPLVDAALEKGKSKQKGAKDTKTVGRPSEAVKQTPAQLAAEAKRKAKEADERLGKFTREWTERLLRCSLADRSSDDCLVALTLPWIVGQCPSHDLRVAHEQALIECRNQKANRSPRAGTIPLNFCHSSRVAVKLYASMT